MAHSPKFLKQRKFLLVLPLIALPFLTLTFWAFGGGRAVAGQAGKDGLNTVLPGARTATDAPQDKMSMYAQSDKDSYAFREQLRMDPYARREETLDTSTDGFSLADDPAYTDAPGIGGYQYQTFSDPNEARIQRKLSELEQSLQEPAPEPLTEEDPADLAGRGQQQRLETMIAAASEGQQQEMEQINTMLEKLIDVQHPDRAAEKLREQSQRSRGRVFPVSRYSPPVAVGLLSAATEGHFPADSGHQVNSFYDLDAQSSLDDTLPQTGIPAVVQETQTLVSGSAIKLRLTADVYVSGELVPAGTFVSGTCSIDGERLKVEISAIRTGKNIYPVSMMAYDLDAIEGIRIPGAISRDAAKDGSDRTLQSLQLMSLNPSLATQAAGAGVEVAKGFLGKKLKLVRVAVKAGHPLLLVDAKTKQAGY